MRKLGALWLIVFGIAIVFAHFYQASIEAHDLQKVLQLGYDAFGRDCLNLVLSSAFESFKQLLPIAIFCLSLSGLAALLVSFGGAFSEFWFRAGLDTLSALPGFLVAMALGVFFPNSTAVLLIASFFMVFPWLTRFLESQIASIRTQEYVAASLALGATHPSVFVRHFLPELKRLLISVLPFLVTRILIVETSLSFLGLGKTSEHETWGRLLYQGRDYLTEAPWILAIAGIPLCITLFSLHLITRDDRI